MLSKPIKMISNAFEYIFEVNTHAVVRIDDEMHREEPHAHAKEGRRGEEERGDVVVSLF